MFNLIDSEARVARKHVKVSVVMENRHPSAYGNGGNETVDQLPNGLSLPSATAIKGGCVVVVRGAGWYHDRPG